jgi:hypothetical protein
MAQPATQTLLTLAAAYGLTVEDLVDREAAA